MPIRPILINIVMDLSKQYGSMDPKAQAEWVEWHDAKLLIAPANNIAFTNAALKHFSLDEAEGDGLKHKKAWEIIETQAGLQADSVLLDWENIQIDGKDVPYTRDKCVELLCAYQQLRDDVDTLSGNLADKRQKAINNTKKK